LSPDHLPAGFDFAHDLRPAFEHGGRGRIEREVPGFPEDFQGVLLSHSDEVGTVFPRPDETFLAKKHFRSFDRLAVVRIVRGPAVDRVGDLQKLLVLLVFRGTSQKLADGHNARADQGGPVEGQVAIQLQPSVVTRRSFWMVSLRERAERGGCAARLPRPSRILKIASGDRSERRPATSLRKRGGRKSRAETGAGGRVPGRFGA